VGVVVGEDGENEGMGKWMLTSVRKAVVGPLCGRFAWFKALPIIEAKSASMLLTSILVVHFFVGLCTHFTLPVLVLLCIAIATDLSSGKTIF
jgi:hypothetical protein